MPQGSGQMVLGWIEYPPLGAANTASIHQCGYAARAITSQPFVGGTQADPCLRSQFGQGIRLLNVSTYKSLPANGCQPGIRVGMHGV